LIVYYNVWVYIPFLDIADRGNILLNSKGESSVFPLILHSFVNELIILIRNINNVLHTYCVILGFLALLELWEFYKTRHVGNVQLRILNKYMTIHLFHQQAYFFKTEFKYHLLLEYLSNIPERNGYFSEFLKSIIFIVLF